MSEKGIPVFDGRGDAYWWLIQLDRFFEAKNWIHDEMKVMWVTLFALRGEAFKWWSSWKQDHHNATWEIFERGLIQEFIPDLWEMLQAAEEEEREKTSHELNVVTESEEEPEYGEDGTASGFLKVPTNLVPPSEMPDPKFPVMTRGSDAMFPPPSEPKSNLMKLTLVERERDQDFTVEPPPPPEPPVLDPFTAATIRLEMANKIEIEEEKRLGEIGSHGSWVFRDFDGSKQPGRPRLLSLVSIIENRPKPNMFNIQRPNSRNTLPVNLASVERSIEGGSRITQLSFAHKPPPKPPDLSASLDEAGSLAERPLSEKPEPPWPPDPCPCLVAAKTVVKKMGMAMLPSRKRFILMRDEDTEVNLTICKWVIFLNLMGQAHTYGVQVGRRGRFLQGALDADKFRFSASDLPPYQKHGERFLIFAEKASPVRECRNSCYVYTEVDQQGQGNGQKLQAFWASQYQEICKQIPVGDALKGNAQCRFTEFALVDSLRVRDMVGTNVADAFGVIALLDRIKVVYCLDERPSSVQDKAIEIMSRLGGDQPAVLIDLVKQSCCQLFSIINNLRSAFNAPVIIIEIIIENKIIRASVISTMHPGPLDPHFVILEERIEGVLVLTQGNGFLSRELLPDRDVEKALLFFRPISEEKMVLNNIVQGPISLGHFQGPSIGNVVKGCARQTQKQVKKARRMGIRVLNDLLCPSIPLNARDSQYQILGWQQVASKIAIHRCAVSIQWINDRIVLVKCAHFMSICLNGRCFNQVVLALEEGGIQVVERDLNLPANIIFSSAIGWAWYDNKNLGKKTSPATKAPSSLSSGANKSIYAPDPRDVGRILQVDIVSNGKKLTLTTNPIQTVPGLGSHVEALLRKSNTDFSVVISQMNGKDHSSHSTHSFNVGRMRIKLCRGWITKAREIYSPTMQLCGVRGDASNAAKALFWQARKGLSFVLTFESEKERNVAIMIARKYALDCNVVLAGPDDLV